MSRFLFDISLRKHRGKVDLVVQGRLKWFADSPRKMWNCYWIEAGHSGKAEAELPSAVVVDAYEWIGPLHWETV